MRLLFTGALLLLTATSSLSFAAPGAPRISVPYSRFTLPNGLPVILHEDHTIPRVFVGIRYRTGSSREVKGRTGFAHLFEHLMFEGSQHVPEGAFDQWLEAVGGMNNAWTSEDATFYFEEVPSNALELPLYLESDRMGFFVDGLGADVVDGQRDVVKNERRQSYENVPYGKASLSLPSELFSEGHPYSWPVIGSSEDLTAASLQDVKEFFQRWYVPANAVLVVAGDITPAIARRFVEKWFADVPGKAAPARPALAPMHLDRERRIVLEDDVELPKLVVAWPTPELFSVSDAPLDLTGDLLATGKNARLYKRLVYEMQIAQSVEAYQSSMERASSFNVEVVARPGIKLVDILRVIDEELGQLATKGPAERELTRARNGILAQFFSQLEQLSSKAERLATYDVLLHEPNSFQKDLARYQSIRANDVRKAVKTHLGPGRVVMSVVPRGHLELAIINPTGGAR